jgi:hypothetical protein
MYHEALNEALREEMVRDDGRSDIVRKPFRRQVSPVALCLNRGERPELATALNCNKGA